MTKKIIDLDAKVNTYNLAYFDDMIRILLRGLKLTSKEKEFVKKYLDNLWDNLIDKSDNNISFMDRDSFKKLFKTE